VGEAAGGTAPEAGGYSAPPGSAPAPSYAGSQTDSGLSDNAAGALAYFTIIPAIIFLVIDPFKTRRFVRFHSFQCLFFSAAAFILWFAFTVFGAILSFFGGMLIWALHLVIQIGLFVIWIIVVIKAYQGQEFRLPVIGDLAAKQV
jgi:uncharacterized membrane protein